MKLQQVFDKFVSVRKSVTADLYRRKLDKFLTTYGMYDVEEITPQIIKAWFDELEAQYSEGNMSMYRKSFAAVFNYARPNDNPVTGIRRYRQEPKRIIRANKEDVLKAIETCYQMSYSNCPMKQRDAAIFIFGTSGARRSNIASLTLTETKTGISRPELIRGKIGYIFNTGGKENMEIVLDEQRVEVVKRYLDIRPATGHDRLFVNLDVYSAAYKQPLSDEGYTRARRRICNLAGLDIITYQEIRRMVGTEAARNYGLETAAEVLGHTSGTEVVRKHYYDPDKEKARHAALGIFD